MNYVARKSTSELTCLPSLKMFGLIWLEWQPAFRIRVFHSNLIWRYLKTCLSNHSIKGRTFKLKY